MSNNTEKGLMNKTKKELVDIILRKDDVEVKYKQDIAKLQKDCISCDYTIETLTKQVSERDAECNRLSNEIDNYKNKVEKTLNEYKKKLKLWIRLNPVLAIVIVVLLLIIIF